MAYANSSAATAPAHPSHVPSPHPMANPGYGKRSVPGQLPRTNHDFAHLPAREAAVAAYLDRLPEGADMSVKTLAKVLPYGQCALGTALNRLQKAGHLRRGRERLAGADGIRWITRSWFSRTARDDDWWAAFTRGDVPKETAPEQPRPRPTRSRAHVLLAALGRTAPALSLSDADCAALAPLVVEWYARGADDSAVLRALTAGLPSPVHHPAALVRRRLTDKLPPAPPPAPAPDPRRLLECGECGVPGRPEALAGGLCRACRGTPPPDHAHSDAPPAAPAIRSYAAGMRAAILQSRRERARA